MKVLKFGGTSVGTAESLENVKKIVEGINGEAIIVVSALGGLTDKLIATARQAASGDSGYKAEIEGIRRRHHDIIERVVPESRRRGVTAEVDRLLDEMERNYDGVNLLLNLSAHTLDTIVSFGERMSSHIVAAMIEDARRYDSLDFIRTEVWFGRSIADMALTEQGIKSALGHGGYRYAIVPGFISTDRDSGQITNLGRGGSDFTAALIAAALDAELLEIWTDVDGFMTADPRVIPTARVLSHMSFVESMELCSYGAKVIYPPTIYPVFHKNIPIKILNTFNPAAPGTLITDRKGTDGRMATGISSVKDTCLVILRGELTTNVAEINSRTYNALAKNGISVLLVSPPAQQEAFSFAVGGTDADLAVKVLEEEYAPELADGTLSEIYCYNRLATIAVVGDDLKAYPGLGTRLINTLERSAIKVHAASDGVSETTITLVVGQEDVAEGMRLIHGLLFDIAAD
ncbi:MAG: aspartate kinase [Muribaculaceae bacterium]|nr:aspartate kinase [Muribaculaceae bacterium]